ncbi:ATP-binding protein [Phytoactinopolyspora endophytica]|uniref:ATP-binding protein n=1 Tax=Phytoactinopolyspora endophytica TaxID=1642495 RepID=UPI00101BB4A2|nr:ATP-binding protein [Phytoactinopolyspora endophytica]
MIRIVDREDELAALGAVLNERPALVVLRGRRRVGKSFLLSAAFAGQRVLGLQADEQDEQGHLSLFAQEAARMLPGEPPLTFHTWDDALRFVDAQARSEPLCLVLDEFQWLCRAQPALPSIVQRYWDLWEREQVPIVVALAGSALSFMEGLLDHDSPLYGRATYRPLLEPLDYRCAAGFTTSTEAEYLLRRFAIVGGTPQYQMWAMDLPLEELVSGRILTRGRPLYDEPLHLLREGEGIRSPGSYLSVLWSIARGDTRFNQIANRTGSSPAGLTRLLERLEELGYIEMRVPSDPKEQRGRGTYRIADPYFRFWYRYVFPNRSRLEFGRVDEVASEVTADLDNHMGHVFEDCCRVWLSRYASDDVMGGFDGIGAWWTRDGQTEVDIAVHRAHRYTLLGSVKWKAIVDERVLDGLEAAREQLGPRAARARLILFARRGFTERLRERAEREDVALVTAADLFADTADTGDRRSAK